MPHLLNILTLCLQIWQRDSVVTKPAVLHVALVVVVVDFAIGVEVLLVIEGAELGVVDVGVRTIIALFELVR